MSQHLSPSVNDALLTQVVLQQEEACWDPHGFTQKEDQRHAWEALKTQQMHLVVEDDAQGMGYRVCFYHPGHKVSLSDLWKLVEGMGLRVQSHLSYAWVFAGQHKVGVHVLKGLLCGHEHLLSHSQKEAAALGLQKTWLGHLKGSPLNSLLLEEGFTWRHVLMWDALVDYVRQCALSYETPVIQSTVLAHLPLVRLWMQVFENRFDPQRAHNPLPSNIKGLHSLGQCDHEIWTLLFDLLKNMVRTNFYQQICEGGKLYVAFKIHHQGSAKPFKHEIFVSSPWMQGVHLRGGDVARGGIRWSDRLGDFRREVMELAQTQVLKNAIIVPTGAKGGFIVTPSCAYQSREDWLEKGRKAYQTLIHGLLDVTDNQINGQVVPPSETVCYDAPDPYLVVAADKGTAAFSDMANQIALERGFWLGDAFASGGSVGYDHKKLGITSSGAWESLKHHAACLGWDKDRVLTMVGVGDMSGDVFGNGLLKSSKVKLVAAFDHRHIFLDPDPDEHLSFQERKRLFDKPNSQWSDYHPQVLSKGGAIFPRSQYEIKLSDEMQRVLGISEPALTSAQLIQAILKAPVDVIWFGGIGTFIKGRHEDDHLLGDVANQHVRIKGDEVRAKIIVEGANLGVTPLGRVQYARSGGRINTDTVDNSAGVTCSDYEVNLKILLDQAVQAHRITPQERADLLKAMTHQVVEKILTHNRQANELLSRLENEARKRPEAYADLIRTLKDLKKKGIPVGVLPSQKSVLEGGLTRPDLCWMVASAKIWVKRCLLENKDWITEVLQHQAVHVYFPQMILDHPRLDPTSHPLMHALVATVWTNRMIQVLGPCLISNTPPKNLVQCLQEGAL